MNKKVITFRPTDDRVDEVTRFLEKEKKRRGSPSINNTIQCVILDYKNNTTIYEPKKKK